MYLLLADDEPAMAEAIEAFLEYHQYTVDWVDNGVDAYEQAVRTAYDGLILDIMMPGMDGLEVLSRLRREGKTMPVLLLTARGELEDRIEGFERGADDYLPKPFDMSELLVRVRAMLRRRDTYHSEERTFVDMTLDRDRCMLKSPSASVPLSRKEFRLMELLMDNPRIYFTADRILDRVWGMDASSEQGTVWVHISYLRKKMAALGVKAVIRSKRGVGYALEEEE